MTPRLWVEFAIVGALATLLLVAGGFPRRPEVSAAPADPNQRRLIEAMDNLQSVFPFMPDTSGRNWKRLSPDVALKLNDDGHYGLRARLFVRVDGRWVSVGIDSPSDIAQFVPAR